MWQGIHLCGELHINMLLTYGDDKHDAVAEQDANVVEEDVVIRFGADYLWELWRKRED